MKIAIFFQSCHSSDKLQCTTSFSTLSKPSYSSLHMVHKSARGATSHTLHLLLCSLESLLNILSFARHHPLKSEHLRISHHNHDAIQQYIRRWFTSSPDSLHMKHQLTPLMFPFFNFSTARITLLTASQVKRRIFLGIHTEICWKDSSNKNLLIEVLNRKYAILPPLHRSWLSIILFYFLWWSNSSKLWVL